jgi:hypothetical protein
MRRPVASTAVPADAYDPFELHFCHLKQLLQKAPAAA